MTAFRLQELRQTLGFARAARECLRAGKLADAVRYHGYAIQTLAFTRGALSACLLAYDRTATLHRLVAELGMQIETAIRTTPAPVNPVDLIEEIAAGIDVLRTRDGVDITEDDGFERARNIVTVILDKYEFRETRAR